MFSLHLIGGCHIVTFLHRLLQLKYPVHANVITLSRAEELLHTLCRIAIDYKEELSKWASAEYYENNVKKIQLPFNVSAVISAATGNKIAALFIAMLLSIWGFLS